MRTLGRLGGALGAALLLTAALGGCGVFSDEEADPPTDIQDPCPLFTDSLLERLAPDADPPTANDGLADTSGTGYLSCEVDLSTAPVGGYRGDLTMQVWVDDIETFDRDWQLEHCLEVGAEVTTAGPGDTGCVSVQQNDGVESRIDAWAWIGSDYEVNVSYQLIFPERLPDTAEDDVRALLLAGVDALPVPESS